LVRQVTALSDGGVESGPFGVLTEAHDVPFQARLTGPMGPALGWYVEPTALHEVWLRQLTPESDASVEASAGLEFTVSEEPFQVSMSGEGGGGQAPG
jgi:hypothetical protein